MPKQQKTLSLLPEEIENYKKILSVYEEIPTKEEHILYRTKIGLCTVTLYSSGKLLIQGPDFEDVYSKLHSKLSIQGLEIGIDETGRGERNGPFVVAGILGNRNDFRAVRDSKKTKDIASKYHEALGSAKDAYIVEIKAEEIDHFRRSGKTMDLLEAGIIDDIIRILRKGNMIPAVIDGSPLPVKSQTVEFIPKGDDKDPLISAASILARHTRDVSKDKGIRKTWKQKKEPGSKGKA